MSIFFRQCFNNVVRVKFVLDPSSLPQMVAATQRVKQMLINSQWIIFDNAFWKKYQKYLTWFTWDKWMTSFPLKKVAKCKRTASGRSLNDLLRPKQLASAGKVANLADIYLKGKLFSYCLNDSPNMQTNKTPIADPKWSWMQKQQSFVKGFKH